MLPKNAVPTFTLKLPSTDEDILYRPFLVKEEKVMLIAKQSQERIDIINAIKEVISACVLNEGFDVNQITTFDMEYLFIKLRAMSVGNEIEFTVEDSTDQTTYDFKLDLNEVEVTFPENTDKQILLDDNLGVMMKYPTMDLSEKLEGVTEFVELGYETIRHCIDYIFDREETYDWKSATKEEQGEFLDTLNAENYQKINAFFNRMPRIEHVFEYKNALDEDKKVYFRKIEDFFLLG